MHFAAQKGHLACVQSLAQHGGDIHAESLLIVRLYIHGISVRFGVAVLALCKKGFLNVAEF